MVTSYWTQLNPTVKISKTKKLFFEKYAYKIKLYAPGIGVLRYNSSNSISERLDLLIKQTNTFYGASYYFGVSVRSNLKFSDAGQLEKIKTFIQNNKDIKNRIEEPYISFYSNDIEVLKIPAQISEERIEEVSLPYSDSDLTKLLQGNIIVNDANNYKYKMILNNVFKKEIIPTLKNIFINSDIDSETKKKILRNLKDGYYPGGYVYTSEMHLAFLLNLACPNMVKKIYNVVHSENK
jgi:hypothetical protein